jgi:Lrp/AsnC family transcriptional regulator
MSDKFVTYDDYDRAILQQMQRNSAQSLEELSEAVHLSRNAVWRRVKRLQDSGLLKARVALLDAQKIGQINSRRSFAACRRYKRPIALRVIKTI